MEHHSFNFSGKFQLESGAQLSGFTLAYSTLGDPANEVIWICHALTANSDAKSWWPGVVGPGKLFDPEKHFIVCVNILGSCYGSTGPASKNPETGKQYFWDFPQFTIRDIIGAMDILREELDIKEIHTCIGGSLGGQQALEWSIMRPGLIKHLVILASNAFHSPWGIAFNESQRMAIKADPTWNRNEPDAGKEGLKAARAIALLSYRNYSTYVSTQKEEDMDKVDQYKASSYQDYQGEKLIKRFNCHSYWYLSKAMDSHNIARGRGSLQAALLKIRSHTLLIGISSDILFPPSEQKAIADLLPGAVFIEMDSLYGHDGFLIESEKITHIISDFYKLKKKPA